MQPLFSGYSFAYSTTIFPFTFLSLSPLSSFNPAFFSFQLMHSFYHRDKYKQSLPFILVGFFVIMGLGYPFALFIDYGRDNIQQWRKKDDDLRKTFRWLAANTPKKAIVLLPPWRDDAWNLSQRAQIVNWWAIRYDKLGEWRQRLKSLIGNIQPANMPTKQSQMSLFYNSLTPKKIRAIIR